VDVVALASVISSAAVGLAGASVALYGTWRMAKTTQEGRAEQRAADGYLKVLSIAEQEARWLDACTFNLGLDREAVSDGVAYEKATPKQPAVTDKATASALIAAFASPSVWAKHTAWREVADAAGKKIDYISQPMTIEYGRNASEDWMKELRELQSKEHATRRALAEAVAHDLGHRKQHRGRRPRLRVRSK
jgi:hypothetical protein